MVYASWRCLVVVVLLLIVDYFDLIVILHHRVLHVHVVVFRCFHQFDLQSYGLVGWLRHCGVAVPACAISEGCNRASDATESVATRRPDLQRTQRCAGDVGKRLLQVRVLERDVGVHRTVELLQRLVREPRPVVHVPRRSRTQLLQLLFLVNLRDPVPERADFRLIFVVDTR